MAVSVTTNVKLIFDVDTNETYVQDLTSWPSVTPNGIPTPLNQVLNMKGLGTLFNSTGGVVFSALNPLSPLIDLSIGDTQSGDFSLPVSSSEIVNGSYPFSYTARGSYSSPTNPLDGGDAGYVEIDDNNISAQLLQAGDVVVISGSTISALNGTWNVLSTSYTLTSTFSRLYLSQNGVPINGAGGDGNLAYSFTRDYVTTYTPVYTGCTKVRPAINFVSRPYNGEFGSLTVTDATDYTGVQLINGSVRLDYPDGLVPAPVPSFVVGTSVTLTEVATGTYTITLNGLVRKTQTDGLTLEYTLAEIRIKGNPANVFERVVVWRDGLCCLQSCIEEIISANYDYLKQGKPSPLTSTVATLALALGEYQVAVSCGLQDEIDSAYENVTNAIKLSGCKCNCDCGCSESPVWITNSSQEGESLITGLQDQINDLQTQVSNISSDYVASVTGLNTDNTDPQNPIVQISVNNQTMTGDGTLLSPISARSYNLTFDESVNSLGLFRVGFGLVSSIDLRQVSLDDSIPFYVGISEAEMNTIFPSNAYKFAVKQLLPIIDPIVILGFNNERFFEINNSGDLRMDEYPNTRDNGVGINYLYTDIDGNLLSGDLEAAVLNYTGTLVDSVTGLNTDNTDPQNPIVKISVDGTTITGEGTPASPLSAVSSGGPLEYVSYFGVSGTSDPTFTVMKNTIGSIVWTRVNFGTYTGTLAGAFPISKTTIQVTAGYGSTGTPTLYQVTRLSSDEVQIRCVTWNGTSWSLSNGFFGADVTIQVYP
jgi:hypothetical protein